MKLVEYASLGPLGQAAPDCRRRAAAELAGRQQPPGGRGSGHVHDRGEAVAIGDGTVPTTVRWSGWSWQQGFHQCSQLLRHQVVNEGGHGAGSCHTRIKERNDVLGKPRRCPLPWWAAIPQESSEPSLVGPGG